MTNDQIKRAKELCEKSVVGSWYPADEAEARELLPLAIAEIERLSGGLKRIKKMDWCGCKKDISSISGSASCLARQILEDPK